MEYSNQGGHGYYGIGGYQSANGGNFGMANYANNNIYGRQINNRNNKNDFSVIDRMLMNRQPYQYNVPSFASMFPSMTIPTMNNFNPMQYGGGAGQFLGGLLGNAPMTAQAPTSSGAGRFV